MHQFHTTCLICNSDKLSDIDRYSKNYLTQCQSCGFVFCKKIPTNIELTNYYEQYSRGGAISPITIKRYNELLDEFENYRKTNNILDIGCGDGHFLEVAQERGWNVFGTEFTDAAIDVCIKKGIKMHKGVLASENYSENEFDIITSFEVIEHINNPQNEINNIKPILRTGGLFYLTTPNFNSLSRIFLGPNWNVIDYPEHLSYYSPKTINSFFQKNGFQKIKIITTGISLSRFRRSINDNKNTANFNLDDRLREKSENKNGYKFIKWAANFFLNTTKSGDALKAYFQK